ncbi:hypothetical protein CH370_17670 [Leptospira kmetyi]|nr:hypothetical protein CH370_17670 [Leptospira kmetyi]
MIHFRFPIFSSDPIFFLPAVLSWFSFFTFFLSAFFSDFFLDLFLILSYYLFLFRFFETYVWTFSIRSFSSFYKFPFYDFQSNFCSD